MGVYIFSVSSKFDFVLSVLTRGLSAIFLLPATPNLANITASLDMVERNRPDFY